LKNLEGWRQRIPLRQSWMNGRPMNMGKSDGGFIFHIFLNDTPFTVE
jgi:hypothetical protein